LRARLATLEDLLNDINLPAVARALGAEARLVEKALKKF
jgi:hypothetical protein